MYINYCLRCLEVRPFSRKTGFFTQMEKVIKFLVGASQGSGKGVLLYLQENVPVQQSRIPTVTSAC